MIFTSNQNYNFNENLIQEETLEPFKDAIITDGLACYTNDDNKAICNEKESKITALSSGGNTTC